MAVTLCWSRHSWSRRTHDLCAVPGQPSVYNVADTGLWGEAVRQRRPIITNDYAAPNPLKRGLPEGHPPLTRHMNVPVFEGGRIVEAHAAKGEEVLLKVLDGGGQARSFPSGVGNCVAFS